MTCDKNAIFRGDDTNAFGQNFLTINAVIPEGWVISKAEIEIGSLPLIVVENPVFPIPISLTSEQTEQLAEVNNCYMAVYDNDPIKPKKRTCYGTIQIKTRAKVV